MNRRKFLLSSAAALSATTVTSALIASSLLPVEAENVVFVTVKVDADPFIRETREVQDRLRSFQISINEARAEFALPPIAGGDMKYLLQV